MFSASLFRRRLQPDYVSHVEKYVNDDRVALQATGDGFLARFESPARALRCAQLVCARVREVGARVHSGECEVPGADLGGIAMHIGARIAGLAGAGEVLMSRTVGDAVTGSGLVFENCGAHSLKGVPKEWEIHAAIT